MKICQDSTTYIKHVINYFSIDFFELNLTLIIDDDIEHKITITWSQKPLSKTYFDS
jgi:hypothetical protein